MSEQASSEKPQPQLHMVLPTDAYAQVPQLAVKPPLVLRTFVRGQDEAEYVRVMHLAGFTAWNTNRIDACFERLVGDGCYVVEDAATKKIVATSMATDQPTPLHPEGGELGWVAGDPDYAGQGLGLAVCAAVSRHLIRAGYQHIYLSTDDWRLPAIKLYLRLGYQPLLFDDAMEPRWRVVYEQLNWPMECHRWIETGPNT